jgi:site-specific recombinase XerD
MTEKAKAALVDYLKARTDDSEYLFISLSQNSRGQKLSRNSVEEIVKKYKNLA